MTNIVLAIDGDMPKKCYGCPIATTDQDAYAEWCAVLEKEIKDGNRRLRGCPIKGTVSGKDIIKH